MRRGKRSFVPEHISLQIRPKQSIFVNLCAEPGLQGEVLETAILGFPSGEKLCLFSLSITELHVEPVRSIIKLLIIRYLKVPLRVFLFTPDLESGS